MSERTSVNLREKHARSDIFGKSMSIQAAMKNDTRGRRSVVAESGAGQPQLFRRPAPKHQAAEGHDREEEVKQVVKQQRKKTPHHHHATSSSNDRESHDTPLLQQLLGQQSTHGGEHVFETLPRQTFVAVLGEASSSGQEGTVVEWKRLTTDDNRICTEREQPLPDAVKDSEPCQPAKKGHRGQTTVSDFRKDQSRSVPLSRR